MTGLKLSGQHRGDEWGAVLVAEWHITEGGSKARILIPPAGVHALRSPGNFVKIETTAAHRLPPHARRLYALLADRKRQREPYAQWSVENLRGLLGVADKRSYDVWAQFDKRVLSPAIEAINDFGTVRVKMTTVTWPNSRSRPLRLEVERPTRGYRNGCRKRTPQRSPAQGSTQARRPPHDRAQAQAG